MKVFALLVMLSAGASAQATWTPPFNGALFDSFETYSLGSDCLANFFNNGSSTFCSCWPGAGTTAGVVAGSGHSGNRFYAAGADCASLTLGVPVRRLGFWFDGGSAQTYSVVFRDAAGNWFSTRILPANWGWNGWDFSVPVEFVWIDSDHQSGGGWSVDDLTADPWPGTPPVKYCTAKQNSLMCLPNINWSGTASASASSGFQVRCLGVRNQKIGLLFYSVSGRQAVPYQGGTLCVQWVIKRTPGVSSGGSAPPANNCTGVYAIDMNAFAAGVLGGNPMPALSSPGTVVDCQWWGRDPPASFGTTLSNALEFTIGP